MTTEEGGSQDREFVAKYAADRVRNASSVWLGMTMGCCECHDHKFDPYTAREFYEFGAFFADLKEIPIGAQEPIFLPIGKDAKKAKQLQGQLAVIDNKLNTTTLELENLSPKCSAIPSCRAEGLADRALAILLSMIFNCGSMERSSP